MKETNNSLGYDRSLTHQMIQELKELRDHPYEPTADIDIVWCLSAIGSYYQEANDGPYTGKSYDRVVIDRSAEIIRKITALRLEKPVEEVTKHDIEMSGPLLYYNGEHDQLESRNYTQNEDLMAVAQNPDFPIPLSNIVFGEIDTANTRAQVRDMAAFLEGAEGVGLKVAVVSLGGHSVRVDRYLEHTKDSFPADVEFVKAAAPLDQENIGTVHREVTKVFRYLAAGHLARVSYYDTVNRSQPNDAN